MAFTKKGYKKKVASLEGQVAGMKSAGHKVPMSKKGKAKLVVGAAGANIGLGVASNAIWDHHNNKTLKPSRKTNYPTTRTTSFSPKS